LLFNKRVARKRTSNIQHRTLNIQTKQKLKSESFSFLRLIGPFDHRGHDKSFQCDLSSTLSAKSKVENSTNKAETLKIKNGREP